jgi:KDO2-lipid IV(A) lauroyltransferase
MPPVSDPRHLSEEDYTRVVTQEFTAAIEKAVRDRPDQWMWIHRRWKTRPEDVKAREEAAGASQASAEGSRAFS